MRNNPTLLVHLKLLLLTQMGHFSRGYPPKLMTRFFSRAGERKKKKKFNPIITLNLNEGAEGSEWSTAIIIPLIIANLVRPTQVSRPCPSAERESGAGVLIKHRVWAAGMMGEAVKVSCTSVIYWCIVHGGSLKSWVKAFLILWSLKETGVGFLSGVRFLSVWASDTDPCGVWHQYSLLCRETAIDGSPFPRTEALHIQRLISQLDIRHAT